MKTTRTITIMFLIIFSVSITSIAFANNCYEEKKTGISINIDFTSFEKIYLTPEKVLIDIDAFIANDPAWQLIKGWHKNNRIEFDRKKFADNLKELVKMSSEERKTTTAFILYQELKTKSQHFPEIATKQANAFLPDNKNINKESTIYFTAFSLPYSFMTNGNMVADIASRKWDQGGSDMILNLLAHEFFHVCYGYNRYYRLEDEYANPLQNRIVDALQNEGIATYLNYNLRDVYPCDHEDFLMFEDQSQVKEKLNMVQNLINLSGKIDKDEYFKLAWDQGVTKRGYYVSGIYMASIIDKRAGREMLIKTIKTGPISFINTYNKVADKDMLLKSFPDPAPNSYSIRIKNLALAGKGEEMNRIADRIKNSKSSVTFKESEFNLLGYRIMRAYNNPEAATLIFRCGTRAHPESANLYDSLGEAYLKCGDREKAISSYKKSLELNPDNANAAKMINEIEANH